MAKRPNGQLSLREALAQPVTKKRTIEGIDNCFLTNLICFYTLSKEFPEVIQISDSEEANSDISSDESIDDENDENVEAAPVNCMIETLLRAECNKVCCSDKKSVYQPKDSKTLALFTNKNRKFLQAWYDKYKWITLCITKKRVFCVNCRFAQSHKLLIFSKKSDPAFYYRICKLQKSY